MSLHYCTKFKVINRIMIRIPKRENRNKYSAICSYFLSIFSETVLIEIKEKMHENVRNTDTIDVNSSIIKISV